MKLRIGFEPEAMDFNSESASEALSMLNELVLHQEVRIEALQLEGDELNVLISMDRDYIVTWSHGHSTRYRIKDWRKLADPEYVKQICDMEGTLIWSADQGTNPSYKEPEPRSRITRKRYLLDYLKTRGEPFDLCWTRHTHEGTIVCAMMENGFDYYRILYYRPCMSPELTTLHIPYDDAQSMFDTKWNDKLEEIMLQLANDPTDDVFGTTSVTSDKFTVVSSNADITEFKIEDFPDTKSDFIKKLFKIVNDFDVQEFNRWQKEVKTACFDKTLTVEQARDLLAMYESIVY